MKKKNQAAEETPPPIVGEADPEHESRIDAARVRAEWRLPLRPAVAQDAIEDLPLFGGERQASLW